VGPNRLPPHFLRDAGQLQLPANYFKRDAIRWAWEFLTHKKWLHLPAEKLSATIYLDDDEAAEIWLDEVKLPPERLQRLGEDENFWPANAPSQGPDGVCGPCSEIYFHTPSAKSKSGTSCSRSSTAWAIRRTIAAVAQQKHRYRHGPRTDGRGLQGVDTNFHIDILRPLVEDGGRGVRRALRPGRRQTAAGCAASPTISALVRLPSTKTSIPAIRSKAT